MFQSTLPHGERLLQAACGFLLDSFNPRSRMGSDCIMHHVNLLLLLFQSTLPHGERLLSII